jgi:protein phosphatase
VTSDPNARVVERSGESDAGLKRTINQDRLLAESPLFVVADGMGGHLGGEVAAGLAIDVFREQCSLYSETDVAAALCALVEEANRRIYARGQEDIQYKGMGTTVVAALVHDDSVTLAHVGDSRAYRLRAGKLEQLTNDHSYVAELVRMGAISVEEAERHPHASVVTRAVGTRDEVEPDVATHQAIDNDVFLLCSDGLTKMVPEAKIASIVAGADRLDRATDMLIAAANDGGGEDNITVCLFRVAVAEETGRGNTEVIDLSVIARAATAERNAR